MSVETETTNSLLKQIIDKLVLIANPPSVQTVKIQRKFITSRTLIDRASVTQTTKANTPDISISNPFDAPAKLISLTLIPDANFKTKGILEIYLNQIKYLDKGSEGDFTDFSTFAVPISTNGYDMRAGEKVELYIYSATLTIALTAIATFEIEYR